MPGHLLLVKELEQMRARGIHFRVRVRVRGLGLTGNG
jgi:hypothetical protein